MTSNVGKSLVSSLALVVLLGGCGDDATGSAEGGVTESGGSTAGSTTGAPTTTAAPGTSSSGDVPTAGSGEASGTSSGGELPGECGDGQVDVGEACDDGAQNGPGQACLADCSANACGDGDKGPGEECDNGAMNGDMAVCKADCTDNVCGDGAVGPGEGCDDGNDVDDDECSNYSSFPATAPTRQLTSKLHGRNRWVFPRAAKQPPPPSPRACPPGLEKTRRRAELRSRGVLKARRDASEGPPRRPRPPQPRAP